MLDPLPPTRDHDAPSIHWLAGVLQGVFLSGLAQLAAAQGSPNNSSAAALVQFAADTAEAAFAYFGAGSAGSVLQELSCGPNG